jgi:hypothetical protein
MEEVKGGFSGVICRPGLKRACLLRLKDDV